MVTRHWLPQFVFGIKKHLILDNSLFNYSISVSPIDSNTSNEVHNSTMISQNRVVEERWNGITGCWELWQTDENNENWAYTDCDCGSGYNSGNCPGGSGNGGSGGGPTPSGGAPTTESPSDPTSTPGGIHIVIIGANNGGINIPTSGSTTTNDNGGGTSTNNGGTAPHILHFPTTNTTVGWTPFVLLSVDAEPMSSQDIVDDEVNAKIIANDATLTSKPRPLYSDMKKASLPPAPHTLPNGDPNPRGNGVNTYGYLDVADKIGGDLKTLLYTDPNPNTCATRLSYDLDHSPSTTPIPATVGPYNGTDGSNYIVGVESMLKYLIKVYDTPHDPVNTIHLQATTAQPLTEAYIKQQLKGKQGIFVLIANDPSPQGFNAIGHVDLLASNGTFADADYTNPKGGATDVYLFILK